MNIIKKLFKSKNKDIIEFTIKCRMKKRWISHFLGMLKTMERLGELGSSRNVTLFSDGDGDFRPKFKWKNNLPPEANSREKRNLSSEYFFDAG